MPDGGNNTISISGSGIDSNSGNSDLIVDEIWLDDEGDGQYDINTKIKKYWE